MTKERDSAPLCLGVIPTAWFRASDVFAFAAPCFVCAVALGSVGWQPEGSQRSYLDGKKDGNGWIPKWKCVDGSELFGKKRNVFLMETGIRLFRSQILE